MGPERKSRVLFDVSFFNISAFMLIFIATMALNSLYEREDLNKQMFKIRTVLRLRPFKYYGKFRRIPPTKSSYINKQAKITKHLFLVQFPSLLLDFWIKIF